MADESIPDYLLQDPDGEPPEPPVDTAEQLLPFHGLTWENFERLCLRVARLEAEPEEVRLFGTRGQKQQGIDVYSRLADTTYATYQCKDYEQVGASDIRNAVSEFLGGEWGSRSSRFVFCTTASLVRTQLATEIETQAERLRSQTPSIRFEPWDAENLSLKLKAHPDLVREFFGPAWLERFSQAQSPEPRADRLDQIHATVDELLQRSYHQVRVVTLDWAPERLRRALLKYKEENEALFVRLTEEIGEPARAPNAS